MRLSLGPERTGGAWKIGALDPQVLQEESSCSRDTVAYPTRPLLPKSCATGQSGSDGEPSAVHHEDGSVTNPINIHMGKRIRLSRLALGATEQQLASRVGLRFHWIQNTRQEPSASAPHAIASALGTPRPCFLEESTSGHTNQIAAKSSSRCLLSIPEALACLRAHRAIPDTRRGWSFRPLQTLRPPSEGTPLA